MGEETKPTPSPEGGANVEQAIPNANVVPPPFGKIVVTAERTEREANLEAELAAERAGHATTAAEKKQREIRLAELEDQLHQLHTLRATVRDTKGSWWFEP